MLLMLLRSGVVDVGSDSSSSICTFLVSMFGDSFVVVPLILRSVFVFVCLRFDLICPMFFLFFLMLLDYYKFLPGVLI